MDNLNYNKSKLDSIDKDIKNLTERKKKIIEKNKLIVYDNISKMYQREGQDLIEIVSAEHDLIRMFFNLGMDHNQIYELIQSIKSKKQFEINEE